MTLSLLCFSLMFGFVLIQNNYGVVDYDEYYENPPCDFLILEDGWTQLSNCVKYKRNDVKITQP